MKSNQAMREEWSEFYFGKDDDNYKFPPNAEETADWWLERWPKKEEVHLTGTVTSPHNIMKIVSEAKQDSKCCGSCFGKPHYHEERFSDSCPCHKEEECKHELTFVKDSKEGAKLYCVKCGAGVENDPNAIDTLTAPDLKIDWWEAEELAQKICDLTTYGIPLHLNDILPDIKEALSQKESQVLSKVREVVESLRPKHLWDEAPNKHLKNIAVENVLSDLLTKLTNNDK